MDRFLSLPQTAEGAVMLAEIEKRNAALAKKPKFANACQQTVARAMMLAEIEEQNARLAKKPNFAYACHQEESVRCNPLDGPRPLNLSLTKSSSLVDLVNSAFSNMDLFVNPSYLTEEREEISLMPVSDTAKKMKATSFQAELLRIGGWQFGQKDTEQVVAKCYYSMQKLIWEIITDHDVKRKIEIRWSNIKALEATFCENGCDTLVLVLAEPPQFFKEINPQPRRQTLWQPSVDFTEKQAASIHKVHYLKCEPGSLKMHFEKLIQCDKKLCEMSRQSKGILEPQYFEARNEKKCHFSKDLDYYCGSKYQGFHEDVPSISSMSRMRDSVARIPDSSDMYTRMESPKDLSYQYHSEASTSNDGANISSNESFRNLPYLHQIGSQPQFLPNTYDA